jgi:hypothetical protein
MKKITILLAVVLTCNLAAQNIITGYHSQSFILQSTTNASVFPTANLVVGFPALSNVNFATQLPLSLNEVLEKGSDDSLRLSLPLLNSNLREHNLFSSSFRNQVFYVGLKVGSKKNVFVYIGDEVVINGAVQFSNKFVDYLTQGNSRFLNQQMDFKSQKIEFSAYNSLYLGAAVKVNNKLELGIRLKFLRGIANVHTNKLNISAYTDSTASPIYATSLSSDILIQTSGRGFMDDTLDFDPLLNKGFAFDIGASYAFTDQLSASFAINDIGSINWDKLNNTLYTTGGEMEFDFNGLTQSSSGDEDLQVQMESLSDSLLNKLQPKEGVGAYTTKLSPSLYLGASYELNEKHSFSTLYHSRKIVDKSIHVFSLGYQYQLVNSLELLASVSSLSGNAILASGFVWSPGPLQLHILVDNIMFANVFDSESFFFQFGLSFHIGKPAKKI